MKNSLQGDPKQGQAIGLTELLYFAQHHVSKRGRPKPDDAPLLRVWRAFKPKLVRLLRAERLRRAEEWRVYGVVDEVTVQTGLLESQPFLVLGVYVREPGFARVTSVAPTRLDSIPLVNSMGEPACDVLVRVAARARKRHCELVSLRILDENALLGSREFIRLLGTISPLHLDHVLSRWWHRRGLLKSLVDEDRRAVGGPFVVPQLASCAKRLTAAARARHEAAIDRARELIRSGVKATDARAADTLRDLMVIEYNTHLTRNPDRQRPSRRYRKLRRSWLPGRPIPGTNGEADRPLGQEQENLDECLARIHAMIVTAENRTYMKIVPARVVTELRALLALLTRPTWDFELPRPELDEKATRDLVHEAMLLVGRESPAVSKTDSSLLEATFRMMAAFSRRLQTERGDGRVLADEVGNVLTRLSCAEPDQELPASWGVADFARRAVSYFVYEKMRAGPRFWRNVRRSRARRVAAARSGLPSYRLCAFADFLVRNRWRVQASPYKADRRRRCRTPIMTGVDTREACCSDACRKNLAVWRKRLRASRFT